jgi:hypothetical protein
MGVNVGLNYEEVWLKKLGEPIVSDIKQVIAGFSAALESVVATGQSDLESALKATSSHSVLTASSVQGVTGANTTETDISPIYNIPADTLASDGDVIRITAWGDFKADNHGKTLQLYVGGASQVSTGSQAWNDRGWQLRAMLIRTGAGSEEMHGQFVPAVVGTSASIGQFSALSLATGSSIAVKITGTNGTSDANCITFEGWVIEKLSAPS